MGGRKMKKECWFKKAIRTKIAFLLLLIPLVYMSVLATFGLIATLLEKPCNREGIYEFFAGSSIFLMLFLPSISINSAIGSLVMQILALKKGESKFKNILMMPINAIYIVAGSILLSRILTGIFNGC